MSLELDIVDRYLGVAYKHHGRDLAGLDCWGLIKMIYKDLGYDLLDIETYDKEWVSKGANFFVENYHLQWERVVHPELFNVVMFKNKDGVACHAGLYLKEGIMIHASDRAGVVLIRINTVGNGKQFDGFYKFKGIA